MGHDHLLELERICRLPSARIDVRVVNRQRIVGKRDAGDFNIEQREFFCRQCCKPDIV